MQAPAQAAKQVKVEQVCFVKPAQPTAVEHDMYMNGLDLILSYSKPSRTILFYPSSSSSSSTTDEGKQQKQLDDVHNILAAFAALRGGLAAVLVPFYPFAGRLAHDESGRLALRCNDAGVELILARCDDILFSELASHSFLPRPFFRQLVPMDHLSHSDYKDAPITSVQLTAFHGGMTVGIANQHSVADGFAFWMFVKALGQACRGEPFSLQPLHYRALLKPDTVALNKFPPKPSTASAAQSPVVAPDNPDACEASYSLVDDDLQPQRRIIQLVLHFSKDMIDTLKKTCSGSGPGGAGAAAAGTSGSSGGAGTVAAGISGLFSTYQVLSAYLWKRYVMARGLDGREAVQFLHLLDIRMRIVPPLTLAFCGNAVTPFFTVSTAQDVKEESLGATAARIRQSIKEVDDYSIKQFVAGVEKLDLQSNVPMNLFRLRNASHFPVYEAGNLGWGEPASVRPPISDTEGEATWYPSHKAAGSIDVVFALLDSTCSRYFSPHLYPNDPLDVSLLAPKHHLS